VLILSELNHGCDGEGTRAISVLRKMNTPDPDTHTEERVILEAIHSMSSVWENLAFKDVFTCGKRTHSRGL